LILHMVLEGGLFVREGGWCPAKGPDRDQAFEASVAVVGAVRISTRPPSGMTVLAAGPAMVGEERGLTA
jgi:hypothetical protein